jgi:hypothetical protein
MAKKKASKDFFFEKKKQKTFVCFGLVRGQFVTASSRHCERREAIHLFRALGTKDGLLRCARNDGDGSVTRALGPRWFQRLRTRITKSFLVLFFKKERLAFSNLSS